MVMIDHEERWLGSMDLKLNSELRPFYYPIIRLPGILVVKVSSRLLESFGTNYRSLGSNFGPFGIRMKLF